MTRALSLLLALAACHTVAYQQRLPAPVARQLFATPHDAAIITHDEAGDLVRITPATELRVVYRIADDPEAVRRRTGGSPAASVRVAPGGLTLPGSPAIPWQRVEAVEVRRVAVGYTVLWFLAGTAIFAGCAYYDCFGQVPR